MRQKPFYLLPLYLLPFLFLVSELLAQNKVTELKIGVRAINGIEKAKQQWTATAESLSQNIDGYHFSLVPIVDFNKMRSAVKNKEIDFVITQPLAYIDLKTRYGTNRILTLNKKLANGSASDMFSSVIFTHADNTDINNLNDIKNRSLMAVHAEAFAGWQMAYREFLLNDIDPYEDSHHVRFSKDNTHQAVIDAVLNKTTEIGIIRSGIIEQLVTEKKLDREKLKVINQQDDKLSSLHSTQLYPEWPFSVLSHVDHQLTNLVFHSLLTIKPDSKAATNGTYFNWSAPLDYNEVNQLIREIKYQQINLGDIWQEQKEITFLTAGFLLAILFYTLYLFSVNRKLASSEIELSHHRNHLAELVEEKTRKLNQEIKHHEQTEKELIIAKLIAEHANNAKSEFLSQMSHEVRTPLNAILGYSQLVKLEVSDQPELLDNINEILTAGNYLLSLINEILDLAQIESGNTGITMESLDWHDVLTDCVNLVMPIAIDQGISIEQHSCAHCPVIADRKRLKQICINLISNAIKYNKPKGQINIDLKLMNKTEYQLRIQDTGIGIKKEFQAQIFTPFSRVIDNPENIEGTGIGLTITKKLVENMNGKIVFESEFGTGSSFFVTLPATSAELQIL